MSIKIKKVYCWEADSNGYPTGEERTLLAESLKWAMRHLAFELGGKVSATGQSVRMPDGTTWHGTNS
jgi:hypothetical protein